MSSILKAIVLYILDGLFCCFRLEGKFDLCSFILDRSRSLHAFKYHLFANDSHIHPWILYSYMELGVVMASTSNSPNPKWNSWLPHSQISPYCLFHPKEYSLRCGQKALVSSSFLLFPSLPLSVSQELLLAWPSNISQIWDPFIPPLLIKATIITHLESCNSLLTLN